VLSRIKRGDWVTGLKGKGKGGEMQHNKKRSMYAQLSSSPKRALLYISENIKKN